MIEEPGLEAEARQGNFFNASWSYPFNEANTRNHAFHLLDGGSVDVPMMRTEEYFGYTAGDGGLYRLSDGRWRYRATVLPPRDSDRLRPDAGDRLPERRWIPQSFLKVSCYVDNYSRAMGPGKYRNGEASP